MKDIDKAWDELTNMPEEQLKSYLSVNPKTGEPDGLYTLLLEGTKPKNLEYVSKRDGISIEAAKQNLIKMFVESGYDVPLSLLN